MNDVEVRKNPTEYRYEIWTDGRLLATPSTS